jgi:hypoxanthine phosphoribosyltransferase
MSKEFAFLRWAEFDAAVARIAALAPPGLSGIYGEARGGLPLAVALSHALEIPLVKHAGHDVMWVDDIVDSGHTMQNKQDIFGHFAAWVVRKPDPKVIHALVIPDQWIYFPWEKIDNVEQEKHAYESSRSKGVI